MNIPDQSLIFTAPDVGQITAFPPCCRFAVKVDRHIQLITDSTTQPPGQESTICKSRVANRHERDDIGRTQSGMDAPVPPDVDAGDSRPDRAEQPLQNRFRRACNRENGAVVARIAAAIE